MLFCKNETNVFLKHREHDIKCNTKTLFSCNEHIKLSLEYIKYSISTMLTISISNMAHILIKLL